MCIHTPISMSSRSSLLHRIIHHARESRFHISTESQHWHFRTQPQYTDTSSHRDASTLHYSSPSSSSSYPPSSSPANVWLGIAYSRMTGLFGSLTRRYLPSGCLNARSAIVRTMPQPFPRETLSCAAKSSGRTVCVDRMTCREFSRGLARDTYLIDEGASEHQQTATVEKVKGE